MLQRSETQRRIFDPTPVASIGTVQDARNVAIMRERQELDSYLDSREAREISGLMHQRFGNCG